MAHDGAGVAGATLSREDLVGTWRLLSWRSVAEDGSAREPFGPAPLGYVVYTADGRMLTTISQPDRPAIGGDLLSGPEAGRLDAFASFIAYAGTFEVEGDDVVHRVEMSLFPDWVGSGQRRTVELSADSRTLTLSSPRLRASGRADRQVLIWERL